MRHNWCPSIDLEHVGFLTELTKIVASANWSIDKMRGVYRDGREIIITSREACHILMLSTPYNVSGKRRVVRTGSGSRKARHQEEASYNLIHFAQKLKTFVERGQNKEVFR